MSMTESERLTIDEIIEHCHRSCEGTEIMAIVRGQKRKDITSKGYWEHYQVANYLEELKQYRAIGTVSEFRELKEKSTAKKPIETDWLRCPNCDATLLLGEKHCICGQHLDWSEGKE